MAEEWDDGSDFPPATNTSQFVDEGRTYGMGRGFKPANNNINNCNNNNNNNDRGVGSKNGHYKGGGNSSSTDTNKNSDENGSSGGGWANSGSGGGGWGGGWGGGGGSSGGGWGGSDDNGRGHGRGGGRGGNRDRNGNEHRGGYIGRGGGRHNDRNGDGAEYDGERDNNSYRNGGRHNDRNGDGTDDDDRGNNAYRSSGRYNDRNDGEGNYQSRGRGGRGGGRGGRGGFRNRDDDNGDGGSRSFGNKRYGDDDEGDEGESRPFRGDGARGGARERSDRADGERNNDWGDGGGESKGEGEGDENPDKPPPVTYIPPEISTDDNELFSRVDAGLNFDKYDDIKVNVTGENSPVPISDFKRMDLRNLVLDNIVKSGYRKPTPVQKYAIPIVQSGRDMMACAQTGSGKTAAFMVPIINSLLNDLREVKLIGGGCEPHCIVVSPTRELAEQIWRQALKFSKDSVIKCATVYGGVAVMHQGNKLANGCHILVATPGRLLDFVERRRISFASVRYVVLDEADRMLDMGFLGDMRKMMGHESMVPKGKRQTLMFSATFSEDVQNVARDFLHNYLFLTVGRVGAACTDVEQVIMQVTKFEKRRTLMDLIGRDNIKSGSRILIFVEMKRTADIVAGLLSENKFPATSIHGDRMQMQREEALRDFRTGKRPILVATSVGARGLDMDVTHVINYDMPKHIDEYVHRIGRTGRVGNRGKATTLFNLEYDSAIAGDLVRILSDACQHVPDWLLESGGHCTPGRGENFGGHDVRNFDNDGSYDNPSRYPNITLNAEPEEEW